MRDGNLIQRITVNPKIMVGKPVIKGTRLTVPFIVGLMAHGSTIDEILGEYEGVTRDDVLACLQFAQVTLERTDFVPLAEEGP